MRHTIILANPRPDSFCAAIAKQAVHTLRALGHTASVRDLYHVQFDPCLRSGEIPGHGPYAPGQDVILERNRLAEIDSLIFVYPFWFNAPPAILKGYVDRVLSMDFGYRPGIGGTEPLLGGRRLTSISTSGAPEAWVTSTGALEALKTVFDQHIAAVTGLQLCGHLHLGGVRPSLGEDPARERLEAVDRMLRATFGGGPAA